ncbi:MAG: DUF1295 domain-containing protein [Myxococcales bacterium]|nr:DUF1295 domain-containing protein [Myxococcales bacterium]
MESPGGSRPWSNAALLVTVMLPSVWASVTLLGGCPAGDAGLLVPLCPMALEQPIVFVNLLFFLNVTLGFWLINLVQRSTWLIDPYWTILPLMIGHLYLAHPRAIEAGPRAYLAMGLLWLWSLRLTYNYFRRERWQLGAREDWRFAKKRQESPHFWWVSFFYAFLSQQPMLVGLTLPLWAIAFHPAPFGLLDGICGALALTGIVIAHLADTQLHAYMQENEARVARGEPKERLLDHGLWRYSRHPNYFGEQLFWWSLAGYGAIVGQAWVVVGTALNSTVLAVVTVMVEKRMLAVPERREIYEAYRRRTSVLIPWPPRAS